MGGSGGKPERVVPRWKPRDTSFKLKDSTDLLWREMYHEYRMREFQTALRDGDFKTALQSRFSSDPPMDNSCGWLPDKPNPVKLWAEMRTPAYTHEYQSEYKETKQIFDLLMKTGAAKFLNEIDPNDGLRPIDVASCLTLFILMNTPGVGLNPTAQHSPLQRALTGYCPVGWVKSILAGTDRQWLDWVNPMTGLTALHVALTTTTFSESDKIELAVELMKCVGAVNPRHRCFTAHPITAPPKIVSLLAFARDVWDQYRSGHLPNQISKAAPSLLQDLVELIVDYAC